MLDFGPEIQLLIASAATIGFLHTLLGPDHYLPFVAMAKANNWSFKKTSLVTLGCGVGHILGSVALGLIGIIISANLTKLEMFESFRGELAAWALMGFGFAYMVWGLRQALRKRRHSHWHQHGNLRHRHEHSHDHQHAHMHSNGAKNSITPWALFIVFILGPCEALIPLLMYPAAIHSSAGMLMVTLTFSLTTLLTMFAMVCISLWGLSFVKLPNFDRFSHAIAGSTLMVCGGAITFLGV